MPNLLNLKKIIFLSFSCLFLFFNTKSYCDSTVAFTHTQVVPHIKCNNNERNFGTDPTNPTSCAYSLWGWGQQIDGNTYTASAPFQTYDNTLAYQSILVDGEYEVTAFFEFWQNGSYPMYVWIDDWATTSDYAGVAYPQNIRLFYTGDAPAVLLNSGLGTYTMYLSGRAHLKAGSKVYFPRIWSQCTQSNFCSKMTYLQGVNCTDPAKWMQAGSGSCFYITLLSYP